MLLVHLQPPLQTMAQAQRGMLFAYCILPMGLASGAVLICSYTEQLRLTAFVVAADQGGEPRIGSSVDASHADRSRNAANSASCSLPDVHYQEKAFLICTDLLIQAAV